MRADPSTWIVWPSTAFTGPGARFPLVGDMAYSGNNYGDTDNRLALQYARKRERERQRMAELAKKPRLTCVRCGRQAEPGKRFCYRCRRFRAAELRVAVAKFDAREAV